MSLDCPARDYTASEDDNVLVQGINGDRNALGYFGYAYYAENMDKLKLVAVDSGSGCAAPSVGSIADGSYSPAVPPSVHLRQQGQPGSPRGS